MDSQKDRIIAYDVARAFAIMVMVVVVVNFDAMMAPEAYPLPWLEWIVDFFYGRAATLFVILSGISLAMMSRSHSSIAARKVLTNYLMKRSSLLLITGAALSFFWDADILHFYALCIVLGAFFIKLPTRKITTLTIVAAFISIPICAVLTVTYDMFDSMPFVEVQSWAVRFMLDYGTSRYYSVFPWIAFFLFGIVLGHRESNGYAYHLRVMVFSALICMVVEAFAVILMVHVTDLNVDIEGNGLIALLRSEAFPTTPLFMLSSTASALFVISLCRFLNEKWPTFSLMIQLSAFGRLSLTWYVGHLLLGHFMLDWVDAKIEGRQVVKTLISAGLFCSFGLCLSPGWLRLFQRGPLETVFYHLANGHKSRSVPLSSRLPI